MDHKKKNAMRNALTQMTGVLTDNAMSDLIMAYDLPAGLTVKIAQAVIRGSMQGVMQNCYDDVIKRQLSSREVQKHLLVFDIAEKTFMELAINDNIDHIAIMMDDSELKYAYEVAEHLSLEAIKQSQDKKIEILGRYYGKRFYQGPADWQDMHQIITMAGSLSLRQIVLIRLIVEGFKDIDPDNFITNPSACVEVNRMRDYGLWRIDMAMFENDSSAGIQIKRLTPTKYTKTVCDALMLEKLSDDDIKRTIESLAISDEGEPAKGLTEEEFVASNSWEYVESEEGINVGGRYKSVRDTAILSEDTTHLSQGKDFMNQAARNVDMGYLLDGINSVMSAIGLFKKCKTEAIYQPAIEDALKILADYFEYCNDHGGLRILRGKRLDYETILADISGEHISECRDYLKLAKEEDISFDVRLNEQDSKKMVEDAINKAEREMKEKK